MTLILKFLLLIFAISSIIKCSNLESTELDESTESTEELQILNLSRQTNSPTSQRSIRELSRKLQRRRKPYSCEMSLEEAWNSYSDGGREVLYLFIKNQNFNPNQLIGGRRSLLIQAIASRDLNLVQELLEIPGLDVNYMGRTYFLPIEWAFDRPEIFDALLMKDVNLLARDVFGSNPIEQALKSGRLDLVKKMLKRAEAQNQEKREEVERLEIEYRKAMRNLILDKKIKIE